MRTARRAGLRLHALARRPAPAPCLAHAAATPLPTAASSRPARALSAAAGGGGCWIGEEFQPLPLVGVLDHSHDSKIFEFGLPDGLSLSLPTCACILLQAETGGEEPVVRPYTPISDSSMMGKFQLLIKRYEGGAASSYVHGLALGDSVMFKHIPYGSLRNPLPSPLR